MVNPRLEAAARRALRRPQRRGLLESDRFALDPALDLTGEELARHHAQLDRWRTGPAAPVRTVQWLIPAFDHAPYGGIHTILRLADGFARRHGAECRFHVFDAAAGEEEAVARRIAAAFPALAGARVSGPGALASLPPCDAAIATFWPTAYLLARMPEARSRFLLIQDRESAFYPAGAAAALAEQTLRLGFPTIVNSPALAGFGGDDAHVFTPSVDPALFHPPHEPRPEAPVRVVLYARPAAMRNAFGLGVAALTRVKQRYGDRVDLVAAGEAWEPAELGIPDGVVRNAGLLPDLPAVAALYRSAHVGLFFMVTPHTSYQPLELMACGAACVSNENPATAWLLEHDDTALLAAPLPSLVADQVGRLVEDRGLRERLAAAGRERVAALPGWDREIDGVWAHVDRSRGA